eukprot:12774945-Prorocentrum_lima.AAC.1
MSQVDVVLAVTAAPTARRDVHGAYAEVPSLEWRCLFFFQCSDRPPRGGVHVGTRVHTRRVHA